MIFLPGLGSVTLTLGRTQQKAQTEQVKRYFPRVKPLGWLLVLKVWLVVLQRMAACYSVLVWHGAGKGGNGGCWLWRERGQSSSASSAKRFGCGRQGSCGLGPRAERISGRCEASGCMMASRLCWWVDQGHPATSLTRNLIACALLFPRGHSIMPDGESTA